jgi:hypothetical protein
MSELTLDALSAADRERFEPLWRGPFDYQAARERYLQQIAEAKARRAALGIVAQEYRPITHPPKLTEDRLC